MTTAKERSKNWRNKQLSERPEEFRAYNAKRAVALYNRNPKIAENQQANFKRSYNENPEFRAKVIRSAVLNRYKMTPTEYDAKLEAQGGHCALCQETTGDAGRSLHVDHDHACCKLGPPKGRTCGKCNRGLLCGKCNRKLGALEDLLKEVEGINAAPRTWLDRAMRYLKKWRTQCSNDFIASSPELRDAHLLGRTGQSAVWTQGTKNIISQ